MEEDGGRFDSDRAKAFLKANQSAAPLTMAELWALPLPLRLVLLEILAASATALAGGAAVADRPAACLWSALSRAVDPEAVGAHVQGLRTVDGICWESFYEEASGTHRALVQDPAGVYTRMDFETRDRSRKAVEQIAR